MNGTAHSDGTHPHPLGLLPQDTVLVQIRRRVRPELCPHGLQLLRANQGRTTRAGRGKEGSSGCPAANVALHRRERDIKASSSFRFVHTSVDRGHDSGPQVGGVGFHPPACHAGSILQIDALTGGWRRLRHAGSGADACIARRVPAPSSSSNRMPSSSASRLSAFSRSISAS